MNGGKNVLREAKVAAGEDAALPAGYVKCATAMRDAAYAYAKAHPFAEYQFRWWEYERDMARRAGQELKPGQSAAIAALLIDTIEGVAANADARGMLLAMWEASGRDGTYMMAKAVVMEQVEAAVERASGQLTAPGDWRCIACRQLLDGYTNPAGSREVPGPGAYTICAYCAALQRVKDEGDGYRDVPVAELNKLPSRVRKELMQFRNAVLARNKEQAGRS